MASRLQRLKPQWSSKGVTSVTVSVSNLSKDASPFEAQFLVDTGAVDCLAPRDKLVAAGIHPEGKKVYELASAPCTLRSEELRVSVAKTIDTASVKRQGA